MLKSWWVSTMTGFALGALIYEPFAIVVQYILLPTMLRHKMKQLVDPTNLNRFPYRTALRETPTTYLAHKVKRGKRRRVIPGSDFHRRGRIRHNAELSISSDNCSR